MFIRKYLSSLLVEVAVKISLFGVLLMILRLLERVLKYAALPKWVVNSEVNTIKETIEVGGSFTSV